MNRPLFTIILLWWIGFTGHAEPPKANDVWEKVATYNAKPLEEISGLAPSGKVPGILWSHNDSGGEASLHALDLEGNFLGSVKIQGVKNKDWEDLCAFQHRGNPYLLIADTGDNGRKRSAVRLHAIAEPSPRADGTYTDLEIKPAWTLTLRYEDGPQDCEAIAVDPKSRRVYLLNKDSKTSTVYEIPLLRVRNQGILIAKKLAVLPEVNNATGNIAAFFKASLLGTRATGMDISPNGRQAVVLTYTDIRLFTRAANQSWAEALTQKPQVIALPSIYQPEALCFSPQSRSIYVSSEETPTPLVRYEIK
ncbi:MAG: hypothetical protein ACI9DF_003309 [Verrucomicrobiales bacterium]|jgi:hypothetical protein